MEGGAGLLFAGEYGGSVRRVEDGGRRRREESAKVQLVPELVASEGGDGHGDL